MKFLSPINVNTEYTLPFVDGTNGQVLTTDGNGAVYWGSVSAGVTNLNALTDVELTSPTSGQILRYELPPGGQIPIWRNVTPNYLTPNSSINALGDVTITSAVPGQILQFNGTYWINTTLSTVEYVSKVQHTVKAGVAISKGQAVYITTSDGTNMIAGLASNAAEATSSKVIGLAAANAAVNDQIFVVTEGLIAGLDTSTATAGDPVWLGTNGNLIFGLANKPVAPAHLVYIGVVTRVQSNNGEIFVNVQNGFELNEIHDALIVSPTAGQLLRRDSDNLWKNWSPNFLTAEADTLNSVTGRGATTTNAITVGGLTVDTSTLVVDATNNRVGIGTASPLTTLDVVGHTYIRGGLLYVDTIAGYSAGKISLNGSTNLIVPSGNVGVGTTTPQKFLDVNGSGIVASFGGTFSPGSFAGIHFGYSESNLNNDSYKKSAIVFERTDNHGQGGNASGKIHFLLNNIAGGSATSLAHSVMVIDTNSTATQGSARVGIGTTSPNSTLDVNGAANATSFSSTALFIANADTSGGQIPDQGDPANKIYSFRWMGNEQGYIDTDAKITFAGFKTPTGTASQFLKANGTVDSNVYITSAALSGYATQTWVNANFYEQGIIDDFFYGNEPILGYNKTNWDAAYGWGNHASAGYLTSYENNYISDVRLQEASLDFSGIGSAFVGSIDLSTLPFAASSHTHIIGNVTGLQTALDGKMPYYHGAISGDPGTAINGVTRIYPTANGPIGTGHFTVFTALQDNVNYGWQFTSVGNDAYFRSKDTTWGGWQAIATQTYVNTAIANLVDAAPSTLDTLNELAAALGDDPNFATTVTNSIATKVPQTRTLTINGTAFDLSANRSWTIDSADGYVSDVRLVESTLSFSGEGSAFTGNIDLSTLPFQPAGSYLTAEADTLATVTGRGASTSSPITINGGGSQPLSLTTSSASPWHLALVRSDLGLTSRVFAHNSPYNGWYFEHNISIAGNTNWHAGNDGSGSGLDADLLDGNHASAFATRQDGARYTTNFNSILSSGFFNAEGQPANAPDDYGQLIVAKGIDTGLQIFGGYNSNNLWFRGWGYGPEADGFYPWRKIWHDGNDGSGSGLDADLLDGVDSSRIIYGENSTGTIGTSETSISGALKSGFYTVYRDGTGNLPNQSTSLGFYLRTAYNGVGNVAGMEFFTNDSTVSDLFYRNATGGGKGPWRTVITNANIGSQSVSYATSSGNSVSTDQTNFSELFIDNAPVATKEYVTSQGYITGYTETDTLASVTGRGATTSVNNVQFNDGVTLRRNTASGPNVHTYVINSGGGYSSAMYIGANPGADWLIGKDPYGDGNDRFKIGSWNGYAYIDITYNTTAGIINFPNNGGLTVNGNTIWHAGNDGAGSGLDADLLDGVNGASFLRNDVVGAGVSGTIISTNNANVDGSNFTVDTVNKTVNEYAYKVSRSGSAVGGILIDGRGIFPSINVNGASVTSTTVSNWNTAYSWGNHATAGYFKLEGTDPITIQAETVTFTGSVTVEGTFTESSSIRFKENIEPLPQSLEAVNALNPVSYNKIGVDDREIGLIAEDVAELFPEVVTYNDEGQPQGIQYQRLSVILLKAVQELTERVNKLENK